MENYFIYDYYGKIIICTKRTDSALSTIAEIDRIGTDCKTDFFDYRNVITDIHQ